MKAAPERRRLQEEKEECIRQKGIAVVVGLFEDPNNEPTAGGESQVMAEGQGLC